MNFKILFLLCVLISASASSFSQDELKTEVIEGKKYYIHKVEPGHTLYGISKKYLVEIDDIINENPDVKDGLKVGQDLRIPVLKDNKRLHKINNPDLEGNFILHKVEAGQTLYNLARQYNVEIADIVEVNPGVQNSMQLGQIVKIPVSKVKDVNKEAILPASAYNGWKKHIVFKGETFYSISKKYEVSIDSLMLANKNFPQGLRDGDTINIPVKVPDVYNIVKDKLRPDTLPFIKPLFQTYKIALLLPFFLDENDVIAENRKPHEKESVHPQSIIGLQFYEGVLMALDSLKKLGLNAKVYVYDTGKDTAQVKEILRKDELKSMDLIIGPLYLSGFNIAANFAKQYNIPIVAPFIQQNLILSDNPFVSKILPAPATQFEQLAAYIKAYYSGQNILIVHNAGMSDKPLASAFVNKLKEGGLAAKEIIYSVSGLSGVQAALSFSKTNIIVVPSNDQVFVTDFVSKLNFSSADKNIILFGTDNWLNFDNLDVNYLHRLNTHLPLLTHIDYDNPKVKEFVLGYRGQFFNEPSNFSFQGFDVSFFYLNQLHKYGKSFLARNGLKYQGLQVNFNLSRISGESGFENKSIIIVKYDDFKLQKVN
jgi:LysM repeat protein